jgi:rSAM/selenodomain-associated transferase 1
MEFPHAQIMVFAKAPIPGAAKTRLIPHLGKAGAAALHQHLAEHCIANAVNADLCTVRLWCFPLMQHRFFEACRANFGVMLRLQRGNDLGERMAYGFRKTLESCTYALIIGSDCPALTQQDLRDALTALEQGHDAVLGPTEDGGYALIGLRRVEPSLFEDIVWGRNDVLDITRTRLQQLRWRWHELPLRWDVDRPEDVDRLLAAGLLQNDAVINHPGAKAL